MKFGLWMNILQSVILHVFIKVEELNSHDINPLVKGAYLLDKTDFKHPEKSFNEAKSKVKNKS